MGTTTTSNSVQRDLPEWLEYITAQHPREIEMGLDRSREVAEKMGLLPLAPRQLVVAGTNGKGSTVRFAESLLLAQGYSVGATLSPHLHRFNERARINGEEATDADFVRAFEAVEAARGDIPLTYYEFSVLAVFWLFHQAKLDAVVLEIGLGGRLDTINIADADVAVVTSIGLDHQNFLGDTLEEIGAEKAAIARPTRPLLLGAEMPDSVFRIASKCAAEVSQYGEHFWYARQQSGWFVRVGAERCTGLTLPQIAPRNAALAVASVAALTRLPHAQELESAAVSCVHPGRFERVSWQGREMVLDVAHNPASAGFLNTQLGAHYPRQRVVGWVGFLADKDVPGIVQALAGQVAEWVITPVPGPRGLAVAEARQKLLLAGIAESRVHLAENLPKGLDRVLQLAGRADIIAAFGCFGQVQQVRELIWPEDFA